MSEDGLGAYDLEVRVRAKCPRCKEAGTQGCMNCEDGYVYRWISHEDFFCWVGDHETPEERKERERRFPRGARQL